MLILAIGDIVGKPGRKAVGQLVTPLREEYGLELVVANGENAAGGLGMTPDVAQEMLDAGVDVLTSGNHIWAQKEIIPYLDSQMPILRPLNYPGGVAGRGYLVKNGVAVVSLIGRTFMGNYVDCPFKAMDRLLSDIRVPNVVVDFHAEATSEKMAMGRYLDGRVSAVLGTHTHVGTVDTLILPNGTAYVTDIGMVGPIDSIIGDDTESVLNHFLTALPHRISVGKGRSMLNAIMLDIDEKTGRAVKIERLYREVD
ncbi:MAG: metallophosphoesterase [Chloroflexi bacterium RBG_16_57_8]|nr:MAG: metallophosphoesterase [Chloroflexi bacterium RBG_16_57_8]